MSRNYLYLIFTAVLMHIFGPTLNGVHKFLDQKCISRMPGPKVFSNSNLSYFHIDVITNSGILRHSSDTKWNTSKSHDFNRWEYKWKFSVKNNSRENCEQKQIKRITSRPINVLIFQLTHSICKRCVSVPVPFGCKSNDFPRFPRL